MKAHWIPIARMTFREILRSRLIYGLLGLNAALLLAASAFAAVSIGDFAKIIKDFGFFLATTGSAAVATISGSSLLSKELSKKTIYNLLSKPAGRSDFIAGKFLGVMCLCCLFICASCAGLGLYAWAAAGSPDLNLAVGAYYILLEGIILCAAAIFFSTIVVTPALGGIFTFALFLTGRGLDQLSALAEQEEMALPVRTAVRALYWVLPQTFHFSVGDQIVYGIIPTFSHMAASFIYSISYASLLLIAACAIFRKRDFN